MRMIGGSATLAIALLSERKVYGRLQLAVGRYLPWGQCCGSMPPLSFMGSFDCPSSFFKLSKPIASVSSV